MFFDNEKNNYTLYGAAFGLCFPVGAIGLELFLRDLDFSLASIIYLHQKVLLLWMIDSAPVVLGIFARYAGIKQDEVIQTVSNMQKIIDERTRVLEASKNEAEKASQEKSQINKLNQIASLANDSESLAKDVLAYMAEISQSQTGILYLAKDKNLSLLASFAFTPNSQHPEEIPFGESQLGQCALEQKVICLNNVDNNYLKIETSMGSSNLNSVVLIPMMFEGRLTGVIEMGSFHPYHEDQIQLLQKCSDLVAISLNSIISREKLSELVAKLEANQ